MFSKCFGTLVPSKATGGVCDTLVQTALLMSGRASSSCRAAILNATTACSKRLLYSHHPSNATIASYVAVRVWLK